MLSLAAFSLFSVAASWQPAGRRGNDQKDESQAGTETPRFKIFFFTHNTRGSPAARANRSHLTALEEVKNVKFQTGFTRTIIQNIMTTTR